MNFKFKVYFALVLFIFVFESKNSSNTATIVGNIREVKRKWEENIRILTQPCMGFANKMAAGVSIMSGFREKRGCNP